MIIQSNIVTDGLVLHLDAGVKGSYPGAGTTWSDLAGGNNGTLTNGAAFDSGNGGNIILDGSNDYVSLGSLSLLPSNSFTVDIWIKFDVLGSSDYRTFFSYGGFVSNGWLIQRNGANQAIRIGFNGTSFYDANVFATTNQWVNIVATVSSGTPQNSYLNGVFASVFSGSGTLAISNPKIIEIGRRADTLNQYVDGSMGELRVYNRTLSASEIAQNFNITRNRFGV